uniref:Matrix metalloproteinase-14 n=1 Tax=Loxodonta africana TaxID=9785 RepID=G3SXP0_LOXAF
PGRLRQPPSTPRLPILQQAMLRHPLRPQLRLLALLVRLLPLLARGPEPAAQDLSLGVDWLTRYGYLPPPHPAQAQLQSPAQLRDAIKVLQRFAGLPETGLMDEENSNISHLKPSALTTVLLGRRGSHKSRTQICKTISDSSKCLKETLVDEKAAGVEVINVLLYVSPQLKSCEIAATSQGLLASKRRILGYSLHPQDSPESTCTGPALDYDFVVAVYTHFDNEEAWTFGSEDGEGTDLFAVAVHEFGHSLGLAHSSAPDSIMRPFYQGPVGDPSKYRLSQDDRDGLQQLYGKGPQTPHEEPTRKPLAPPPQPPALPPDRPGAPGPSLLTCPCLHSPSSPFPDRCEGNFDAIANIRGETFFFKGPWFWRLQPSGQLVSPRPARLHRFWEGLPTQVRVIQAAYARHRDGRIVLFSGPQFWVFKDRQLEGAARPLTELGLPPGEQVDAVFSWPLNGKTYLVRSQQYWRYDEAAGSPDPGYPRALSLWEGAPSAPDD